MKLVFCKIPNVMQFFANIFLFHQNHPCMQCSKAIHLLLGRQVESKLIGFYNLLYGHRHLAAPSTHTYMARIPSPACKLISCYNLIYGHRHLAAPSTHTVHIWHIYPVEQANQLL